MSEQRHNRRLAELNRILADLFVVDAFYMSGKRLVFSLRPRFDRERAESLLRDRLELSGYDFELNPSDEGVLLSVAPGRRLRIPRLNIVLFFVTLVSVYLVPVFFLNLDATSFGAAFSATLDDLRRGRGLEFTAALISILFVHEMGHFLASRRRGIVTSWPYFIPAPNIIGTFGAVIRSKSPFWNRRDLIEVGATGPVAGWVVAFLWLVYGLSRTPILPEAALTEPGMFFTLHGESILIRSLVPLLIGSAGPGEYYAFSEAAFAGWVGMLVTAINMLPIGQLDGGHVIYGLAPKYQRLLAWGALGLLLILGFQSPTWWMFAALGLLMGTVHPPTLDDRRPLPLATRVLGYVALAILAVSFTPVPFR